jgi:CheY-like chemotaxis protein
LCWSWRNDEALRGLFVAALAAQPGVRAVGAADGVDGLQRAAQLHPRVVLVDLVMPQMDGATLCRALRARAGRSVAIIALSAAPRDGERDGRHVRRLSEQALRPTRTAPARPPEPRPGESKLTGAYTDTCSRQHVRKIW